MLAIFIYVLEITLLYIVIYIIHITPKYKQCNCRETSFIFSNSTPFNYVVPHMRSELRPKHVVPNWGASASATYWPSACPYLITTWTTIRWNHNNTRIHFRQIFQINKHISKIKFHFNKSIFAKPQKKRTTSWQKNFLTKRCFIQKKGLNNLKS